MSRFKKELRAQGADSPLARAANRAASEFTPRSGQHRARAAKLLAFLAKQRQDATITPRSAGARLCFSDVALRRTWIATTRDLGLDVGFWHRAARREGHYLP